MGDPSIFQFTPDPAAYPSPPYYCYPWPSPASTPEKKSATLGCPWSPKKENSKQRPLHHWNGPFYFPQSPPYPSSTAGWCNYGYYHDDKKSNTPRHTYSTSYMSFTGFYDFANPFPQEHCDQALPIGHGPQLTTSEGYFAWSVPVWQTNYTIADLHALLLMPITPEEWNRLSSSGKSAVRLAFEQRCMKYGGGEQGVKRVDYLLGKTHFAGMKWAGWRWEFVVR
ncbi:hypothetical protein CPB85DRAFT_1330639 [Mucidula mucida]|nr:hypothetical protein CPB85DRAFT_1330608 [Mucidula mucida]KAF8893651.1 hypothetical protein CPB85DRAFT_1330639 [Mucidula mucida]